MMTIIKKASADFLSLSAARPPNAGRRKPFLKQLPQSSLCAFLCLAPALLTSCSREAPPAQNAARNAPAPVTVAAAVQTTVPSVVAGIGHVNAFSTVAVMAQVDGQLAKVHFQQGDELKEDQIIFEIDPAVYQSSLNEAEAMQAKDAVQAKKADADVRRSNELFANKIESPDVHEQTLATAASLKATLLADEAAVQSAKLQLSYCTIRSPINGRAGKLLVNVGNLIRKQDTTLLVINQTRPIFVDFSVPESELPEIKKYLAQGKLKVEASAPRQEHPSVGELLLINNTVDTNTGNVSLRASFPNTDESLWPGQFVEATVTLTAQTKVVVPAAAVQNSQNGQYVFVVKPDNTVENRPIVAGVRVGDNVAVERGLQTGEQVVTTGQLKLISGSKVVVSKPSEAPRKSGATGH